jgi:hypothetical protein
MMHRLSASFSFQNFDVAAVSDFVLKSRAFGIFKPHRMSDMSRSPSRLTINDGLDRGGRCVVIVLDVRPLKVRGHMERLGDFCLSPRPPISSAHRKQRISSR